MKNEFLIKMGFRYFFAIFFAVCTFGCGDDDGVYDDEIDKTSDEVDTEGTSQDTEENTDTSDTGDTIDTSVKDTGTKSTDTTGNILGTAMLQGEVDHAGITVSLNSTDKKVVTPRSGEFTFEKVLPGTYTITATLAGYEPVESQPFAVRAGEDTQVPALTLRFLIGALSGRFILDGKDNHAGILVEIEGTVFVTTTSANGNWSIADVPVGNYSVIASYEDYVMQTVSDQNVQSGQETQVPRRTLFTGITSISGTVNLEGIVNLEGTRITATYKENISLTRSATTNSEGYYSLPGIEPGEWNLSVSRDGYVTQSRSDVNATIASPATNVDFELLIARGSLSGTVELDGVLDKEGIKITLEGTSYQGVSDDQGNWIIENIPTGSYTVLISYDGYEQSAVNISVVINQVVQINHTILGYNNAPTSFVIISGNNQEGIAGQPLEENLIVEARNIDGLPVSANVLFNVTSGNGVFVQNSSNNVSTTTNQETGRAQVRFITGTDVALSRIEVSVDNLASVVFEATGIVPTQAEPGVQVNNQSAVAGQVLENPITGVVKDSQGNALAGVPLEFAPAGGLVSLASAITDENGVFSTSWTMPTAAGPTSLEIRWNPAHPGQNSVLLNTINATALVGQCASLVRQLPGEDITPSGVVGRNLSHQLAVLATDANGNPVPSENITWSFEDNQVGLINSEQILLAQTASNGISQVAAIAGEVGNLQVKATGCEETVVFNVQGTQGGTLSFDQSSSMATVGQQLSGGLSFTLKDGPNAQVGVQVDVFFAATDGEARLDGQTQISLITDSEGKASFTYLQGELTTEQYIVSALVKGLSGSSAVSIEVDSQPDVPASITAYDGHLQQGLKPCQGLLPFVALVQDQYGNLVPGATVDFELNTQSLSNKTTNPEGLAQIDGLTVSCDYPSTYNYTAKVAGVAQLAEFEVTVTPVSPVITALSPDSFKVGVQEQITITGSNFQEWTKLYANETELTILFKNSTTITATLPGALVPNCQKPVFTVWNYNHTQGTNGHAQVTAQAMHNVEELEYHLAWPGFEMEMLVWGYGIDVNIQEGRKAFFTTQDNPGDVLVDNMQVQATSATEGSLGLVTQGLVAQNTYDLYFDDGSGALCQPVAFDIEYMWPETGQTSAQCSNGGTPGLVDCAAIAQGDYYGQDGHYNDPRRVRNFTDNGETIKDNVTGLTWQKSASSATMNWAGAMTHCAEGWRLPSIHELWTLIDLGRSNPAIDSLYTVNSSEYWSSTCAGNNCENDNVWYVDFRNGASLSNAPKTLDGILGAICVQGPEFGHVGLNDYEVGISTVTDLNTHLVWQKTISQAADFKTALAACEGATTGGYTDWRLPDRTELATLVDLSTNPALPGVFEGTITTEFYSSTHYVGNINDDIAWGLALNIDAATSSINKTPTWARHIICVRN